VAVEVIKRAYLRCGAHFSCPLGLTLELFEAMRVYGHTTLNMPDLV
jgi:hypothetical protein